METDAATERAAMKDNENFCARTRWKKFKLQPNCEHEVGI